MNKTHDLKTWPEYFSEIAARRKTFELRLNDRDFRKGDTLRLIEFDPCRPCNGKGRVCEAEDTVEFVDCPDCKGTGGKMTGQALIFTVGYVLAEHQALRSGYVIMGLQEVQVTGSALTKQPTEATRQVMSAAMYRMAEWLAKGGRLVQGSAKAGSPQPNLIRIQMDMTVARPDGEEAPRIVLPS